MIPTQWGDEYRALVQRQRAQQHERYAWSEGEQPITDADFEALRAIVATPNELAQIATDARGQYVLGDTRGFVIDQETLCVQYNCWMVRNADGTLRHQSEPPGGAQP